MPRLARRPLSRWPGGVISFCVERGYAWNGARKKNHKNCARGRSHYFSYVIISRDVIPVVLWFLPASRCPLLEVSSAKICYRTLLLIDITLPNFVKPRWWYAVDISPFLLSFPSLSHSPNLYTLTTRGSQILDGNNRGSLIVLGWTIYVNNTPYGGSDHEIESGWGVKLFYKP